MPVGTEVGEKGERRDMRCEWVGHAAFRTAPVKL